MTYYKHTNTAFAIAFFMFLCLSTNALAIDIKRYVKR